VRAVGHADFGIPGSFDGRDRLGIFPAPHEARNLIGFLEAVHPAPEPVLIAMLARTEVFAGADPDSTQRFTAEQTSSRIHFEVIVRCLFGNC
jgi:hypothetical protein